MQAASLAVSSPLSLFVLFLGDSSFSPSPPWVSGLFLPWFFSFLTGFCLFVLSMSATAPSRSASCFSSAFLVVSLFLAFDFSSFFCLWFVLSFLFASSVCCVSFTICSATMLLILLRYPRFSASAYCCFVAGLSWYCLSISWLSASQLSPFCIIVIPRLLGTSLYT
jgi:hypothetical protein